MNFQNEKSLREVKSFLAQVDTSISRKKCEFIFNEPNIYKYKILSAHFAVRFQDDFSLKVLKQYGGLYQIEFFHSEIDYIKINQFINRDSFFNFFGILCEKYTDLNFGVKNYYPENFERTQYFKDYYKYYDDKKGNRHYGLRLDKAIIFIRNNYDFIKTTISNSGDKKQNQ